MPQKTFSAAAEFSKGLALQAGAVLKKRFKLQGTRAKLKADNTILTKADLEADELIRSEIHKAFPSDLILSEEGQNDPIDSHTPIWVIDPLDGTSNFSLGLHTWGVSIARIVHGSPALAAIYFPLLEELYTAELHIGAALNGYAIQTKGLSAHRPIGFFNCCTRTMKHYRVRLPYKTRILGSACYDFCAVARGVAVGGFQATPKIWDIAAGWLILQEAGGSVGLLEGPSPFPLLPKIDYTRQSFPVLMAADNSIWQNIRAGISQQDATSV